jgi:hypothetical protein
MSDNWEEFMDIQDETEHRIYHFYWTFGRLEMIKDDKGNVLAGVEPKTWHKLETTTGLSGRLGQIRKQVIRLCARANIEKRAGKATVIDHNKPCAL